MLFKTELRHSPEGLQTYLGVKPASWHGEHSMTGMLCTFCCAVHHLKTAAQSQFTNRFMINACCKPQQRKRMHAERWHAPRLSLYESLREPEGLQQLAPPHNKGYLLKWDLDITRFHTEDLV